MNYYIADTHFGHKNILKYEPDRPGNSIEEMQEIMIEKWNNKVKEKDNVFILGDFAFRGAKMKMEDIVELLKKLNGNKWLIIGNHDKNYITKLCKYGVIGIADEMEIYDGDDYVVMSHYPFEIWNHKHHGAIHLHGHTHKSELEHEDYTVKNRYNVGCVWFNYEPVTLKEIKEYWKEVKQ